MSNLLNLRRDESRGWLAAVPVALLVAILLNIVPICRAGTPPETRADSFARPATSFAIADFDSDGRPDVASVQADEGSSQNTRYQIDFQLTTGLRRSVGVTAPAGGLQLRSADVNGDGYADVIVTTFWANQPVTVLLNDGKGNFTRSDPSAFPGAFTNSRSYFNSSTDRIRDGAIELISRFVPGDCEECGRVTPLLVTVGLSVGGTCDSVTSLDSRSFQGRAPPHVAVLL